MAIPVGTVLWSYLSKTVHPKAKRKPALDQGQAFFVIDQLEPDHFMGPALFGDYRSAPLAGFVTPVFFHWSAGMITGFVVLTGVARCVTIAG